MSDAWLQLLLVLGVLYGLELLSYLPPPRRLLCQGLGRRFRLSGSDWQLRSPWPWALSLTVEEFRILPTPTGVYAYQPHRLTSTKTPAFGHRFVRWHEIRSLRALGAEVLINDQLFLRDSSDPAASRTAEWLVSLWQTPPARREAAIVTWRHSLFDLGAARTALAELRAMVLPLRILGTLLFLFLVVTPVLIGATEWALAHWPRFVVTLVVLLATIAWQLFAAHQRLYPAARGDRWLKTVLTPLNFPFACRAAELVARERFSGFHLLALSRLLCRGEDFAAHARAALLALRFPDPPRYQDPTGEITTALAWHRQGAFRAVEEFLTAQGLAVDALLAPPPPSSPEATGYCPRCRVELFRAETGECPDCGVEVIRFAAPDDGRGRSIS